MSIQIDHLTKLYGRQPAVNDISISIREGEIVGFLGPNGAGKSTTMKIATGYLAPTSGRVVVAGIDVATNPLEAKRHLGYLPEHNPLYADMYVREYLAFTGGIFGLSPERLKKRIPEMIDRCGLTGEQNKKIESLSKGYRQRVGLAQALIHDPRVLILDEPTSGLDPNQLVEIRKLVRDVSKNKTVIFSTHIMQEVQALCDRVIVIHKGELVADDKLDNLLRQRSGSPALVVEFESGVSLTDLETVAGAGHIEELAPFKFRITAKPGVELRSQILALAAERKFSLLGFRQEETSLETIFKELTTAATAGVESPAG